MQSLYLGCLLHQTVSLQISEVDGLGPLDHQHRAPQILKDILAPIRVKFVNWLN